MPKVSSINPQICKTYFFLDTKKKYYDWYIIKMIKCIMCFILVREMEKNVSCYNF